jgi:deazaflavin-dependent oxidoreductase (nitroreductase family)
VWYLNLVADPRCEVQIGETRWHATARTVTGAERVAWWARITVEQPVQIEYQKRTAREIPILLLDRVT